MIKFFIAPTVPGWQYIHLVAYHKKIKDIGSTLFTSHEASDFKYTSFTFVDEIAAADYILIPHGIKYVDLQTKTYLDEVRKIAAEHHKKIVVFIGGDLSHYVFVDDMIVLKGSQYKYLKKDNEIIVPPFVEDLLEGRELILRQKSRKPIVGFCGWAGFATPLKFLKYSIKNILQMPVHKKGIYWRIKAMNILKRSEKITTNFIIRKSFSANKKTILLDPAQARREYIENIESSDFILAPKGDANYSVRFFEVLSLGRIPLLIDTETLLPLEWMIDYSSALFRISYKDIQNLPEKLMEFYTQLTQEQFQTLQKNARDIYKKYIRYDMFFNELFLQPLEHTLEEQKKYYEKLH